MIKNYLKVALRNILKHKFFSAINILGMTAGITSCLMIILYVQDELSFDKFNKNADRMYQVSLHGKLGGQDIRVASTCPPLAAALVAEIPEVESATRIDAYGQVVIKYDEKAFIEPRVFYVDSNFFQFFSYSLIEGDAKTALIEPASVVMTQSMVKKYFDKGDALGKIVTIGNENRAFKVTGIAKDSPANSHFRFDFLLSASSTDALKSNVWLNNFMYNYFTIRENASIEGVQAKLQAVGEKYFGPELEKYTQMTLAQLKAKGGDFGYFPTRVTDIHLRSTVDGGLTPGGNIVYVYSFAIIAVFIMVIACINFMNMSTAQSAGRAKEVGLRKTLGSLREQMIGQFLAESMIYSLLAMAIALAATWLLLPGFNTVAGKEISIHSVFNILFLGKILAVIIVVGILAGSYPAFYLTSFNVVEVLKGKVRAGVKSQGVRSALVVFQFGISIFLIIATAIVFSQLRFMQNRDLGFDKKNVLFIHNVNKLGTSKEAFRDAFAQRSDVAGASFTNNSFPGVNSTTVFRASGSEQDHIMGIYRADYEQQKVMKFSMALGRFFSRDFPSDSTGIIVNEAAVREFGWKDPLAESLIYTDDDVPLKLHVVGVFKDFNFESLKERVRPIAVMLTKSNRLLTIRYTGSSSEIIAAVENEWKKLAPSVPLEYHFLDDNYDELFRSEQRLSKIIMIFSGLAIFIACLGLFALAAFTAEQRTKEIGIRKSMGATVSGLTLMISKDFIKLVVISFALVIVPTWWLSDWWLSSFAFRTSINPWIFVSAGVAAVLVAWITVSFQSLKAAASDPVKSLRYQ